MICIGIGLDNVTSLQGLLALLASYKYINIWLSQFVGNINNMFSLIHFINDS